ncbi:MAG: hypothetical protein Q4E57_09285 [Eubacteriales bacterium]|nr:hypothetical protein [Eubacteriales bacterium]
MGDIFVAKSRKYQNRLMYAGIGFIVFGVWTFVKSILTTIQSMSELQELLSQLGDAGIVGRAFVLGVIGFAVALDILIRSYIGLSAISEGHGEKKSFFYVFVTAIFCVIITTMDLSMMFDGERIDLTDISAIIMDFTTCIAGIEILIYSYKLRKLKRIRSTAKS